MWRARSVTPGGWSATSQTGTGRRRRRRNLESDPQKEEEWWYKPDQPEKAKPTIEELMVTLERMKQAQQGVPRGLVLKQGAALVFVIINAGFLYANITNSAAGYIAAYILPLSALLIDYFLVVAEITKIDRGEKKTE